MTVVLLLCYQMKSMDAGPCLLSRWRDKDRRRDLSSSAATPEPMRKSSSSFYQDMETSANTSFMKAMCVNDTALFFNMLWFAYKTSFDWIQLEDVIVCISVIFQGIYALVEFTKRESVASLLEEAAIPTVSHEALVPFKTRLLSLKNIDSVGSTNQQYQPQTTAPINQLIQRLSREESVSGLVVTHRVTVSIKQSWGLDSTLNTKPYASVNALTWSVFSFPRR